MKNSITKYLTLVLVVLMCVSLISCEGEKSVRLKLASVTLTEEEYAFVCKKGNTLLVDSLNEFLGIIEENGELAEERLTMVIVTHEMKFAREVASRVLFMNEGRIEADSSPDEIFGSPEHPRLKEFLGKIIK